FYYSTIRPDPAGREAAIEAIKPLMETLNERLKRYDHVLGDRFRLPDLLIGHGLALLLMSKAIPDGSYTAVVRYLERLAARPAARTEHGRALRRRAGRRADADDARVRRALEFLARADDVGLAGDPARARDERRAQRIRGKPRRLRVHPVGAVLAHPRRDPPAH